MTAKTLTWNGSSRNAPDTPPVEVTSETASPANRGTNGETSTSEIGKIISATLDFPTDAFEPRSSGRGGGAEPEGTRFPSGAAAAGRRDLLSYGWHSCADCSSASGGCLWASCNGSQKPKVSVSTLQ